MTKKRIISLVLAVMMLASMFTFATSASAVTTCTDCSKVYTNTAKVKLNSAFNGLLSVHCTYYLKTNAKDSSTSLVKIGPGDLVRCYGNYMTGDYMTGRTHNTVCPAARSNVWLLVTITKGNTYYYGWFPGSYLADSY